MGRSIQCSIEIHSFLIEDSRAYSKIRLISSISTSGGPDMAVDLTQLFQLIRTAIITVPKEVE
ncbi:MAG TPA: hypothetical protein VHH33_05750 [Nitrososphaeraceae archaeon]|nr:hypothetical protein [Nitrososphaeraceae archaeon]